MANDLLDLREYVRVGSMHDRTDWTVHPSYTVEILPECGFGSLCVISRPDRGSIVEESYFGRGIGRNTHERYVSESEWLRMQAGVDILPPPREQVIHKGYRTEQMVSSQSYSYASPTK